MEASVLVEARHLAGRVQPTRDGIDEPVDRVDRASEFGLGREVWDDDKAVIEELCVLSRSQWSRRIRRAPRRDAAAELSCGQSPIRKQAGARKLAEEDAVRGGWEPTRARAQRKVPR